MTFPTNGVYTLSCSVNGAAAPTVCQKTVNVSDYTCTGTPPANTHICPGTERGLTSNTSYQYVSSCGSQKCTYTCQDGYTWENNQCVPPVSTTPGISVEKNDTDNLDDSQQIDHGGQAKFSIIVTNNGNEKLSNISLTDQYADNCNRSITETRDLI